MIEEMGNIQELILAEMAGIGSFCDG